MTCYGYARVSTTDQDLSIQIDELKKAGCQVVRSEKVTGTTRQGREELKILMEFIQPGDEIVITRMDRLARSAVDLLNLAKEMEEKNVSLRILNQNIDTSTSEGKLFLTMLAGFAEFETNLRKERQAEGIAKAKAEGRYKGRKPSIDRTLVFQMVDQGMNKSAIARALNCHTRTVRRITNEKQGA